jgi:hypothetical protein
MEIANAADRLQFQEANKTPHVFVDCEADLIAKRDEKRLIAGDLESRIGGRGWRHGPQIIAQRLTQEAWGAWIAQDAGATSSR